MRNNLLDKGRESRRVVCFPGRFISDGAGRKINLYLVAVCNLRRRFGALQRLGGLRDVGASYNAAGRFTNRPYPQAAGVITQQKKARPEGLATEDKQQPV